MSEWTEQARERAAQPWPPDTDRMELATTYGVHRCGAPYAPFWQRTVEPDGTEVFSLDARCVGCGASMELQSRVRRRTRGES